MQIENIKFRNIYNITRKMYKKYAIENENDLEKAKIVGVDEPIIKKINFDYKTVLDKIYILDNELDYVNNPYVSKLIKVKENTKKTKEINKLLINFVKPYGIPNVDDGINILELINRIYRTNEIYNKVENNQNIAWEKIKKSNSFEKEIFENKLESLSRNIYRNIVDYPVFPNLFYNEKTERIEIKFISRSIISIVNFCLLLECADNDVNFNTCKYCGKIFKTKNARTKICLDENCKRERKRLYQQEFRNKKKKKKK